MGRRKIDIVPIKEYNRRKITLKKRAAGLLKKAMELSILCDCEIGLFVMGEGNTKLMQYTSSDAHSIEELMLKWIQTPGAPEVEKSNADLLYEAPDASKNASTVASDLDDSDEYSDEDEDAARDKPRKAGRARKQGAANAQANAHGDQSAIRQQLAATLMNARHSQLAQQQHMYARAQCGYAQMGGDGAAQVLLYQQQQLQAQAAYGQQQLPPGYEYTQQQPQCYTQLQWCQQHPACYVAASQPQIPRYPQQQVQPQYVQQGAQPNLRIVAPVAYTNNLSVGCFGPTAAASPTCAGPQCGPLLYALGLPVARTNSGGPSSGQMAGQQATGGQPPIGTMLSQQPVRGQQPTEQKPVGQQPVGQVTMGQQPMAGNGGYLSAQMFATPQMLSPVATPAASNMPSCLPSPVAVPLRVCGLGNAGCTHGILSALGPRMMLNSGSAPGISGISQVQETVENGTHDIGSVSGPDNGPVNGPVNGGAHEVGGTVSSLELQQHGVPEPEAAAQQPACPVSLRHTGPQNSR
mmetsp:Transcript_1903/g.4740  ORF Transcript_1903/g.4740 Transcript_1903/m.4740 type:complete len:521 (+) Transcript_1903:78-1640(+)